MLSIAVNGFTKFKAMFATDANVLTEVGSFRPCNNDDLFSSYLLTCRQKRGEINPLLTCHDLL